MISYSFFIKYITGIRSSVRPERFSILTKFTKSGLLLLCTLLFKFLQYIAYAHYNKFIYDNTNLKHKIVIISKKTIRE